MLCPVYGVRLASPEIEIPTQAGAGLAHPKAVSRERRGDQIILGSALIQRAGIEVGARLQPSLRRLGQGECLTHPGSGFGQGWVVFGTQTNQSIELRILK